MRNKYLFLLAFLFLPNAAQAILPIQHWLTASGAKVYFVENRAIPMLDLSIDFAAGSGMDHADKPGVASMTNRIMRLGAEGMDEDAIARRTADIGAGISGRFDSDRAGLYVRTLSSRAQRDEAMEVFTRILQKPVFPTGAFEREKTRLIGAIKESDIQPGTIVSRTFNQLIYGNHPYGKRASGDVESVGKMARDDLVTFYQRHYVARDAVIAIMGDVSRDEANALAEQITAGLPPSQGAAPVLPPVEAKPHNATRMIAHHASQSHILVGAVAIARGDADYFPLFVGNYVLGGGGFASRISEEVRQKRGLAYSAYSYFAPAAQKGTFVIGMQTRKDQAKEALDVTMKTLRDYVANGPTAKELEDAKKNLVGGFPLRIDSNRKIHDYLTVIGFYKLPLTYLDDFVKNIERVTVADIKRAFAARINPDQLVTVVVGAEDGAPAAAVAR